MAFLAFNANSLAKSANNITKDNTEPYFEIAYYTTNEGDESGYVISNSGGRIQSATIVLTSYIEVFEKRKTSSSFYFPYDSILMNYTKPNDQQFALAFENLNLGLKKWDVDNELGKTLSDILNDSNIWSNIIYHEVLEIQYLDANRSWHNEYYWVEKDEKDNLYLIYIPEDYWHMIKGNIYDDVWGTMEKSDTIGIQISMSGHAGVSRAGERNRLFSESVKEIIQLQLDKTETLLK